MSVGNVISVFLTECLASIVEPCAYALVFEQFGFIEDERDCPLFLSRIKAGTTLCGTITLD